MDSSILIRSFVVGILVITGAAGADILSASVSPSHTIVVGGEFRVTCTVDTHQSTRAVILTRRLGDLSTILGRDGVLVSEYSEFRRFLYSNSIDGSKKMHTFTVTAVGYEDTASYECTLMGTEITASVGVAVCEDTSVYSCECMVTSPLDPICFEEPSTVKQVKDSCQRVNIGLGVILALTVIYAVVMSIYLGKDHLMNVKNENQERLNQAIQNSQNRRQGYQQTDTTILDPNDSASNIEITTDSPACYPANHLEGAGPGAGPGAELGQGARPREEDVRDRPRQVGRQGERRRAPVPGGHSNAAYNASDEPHHEHAGGGNPIGAADIGYAPYPTSPNYPLQQMDGTRLKTNPQPSPRPSTHSTPPVNQSHNSASSLAPPTYGDAHSGHPRGSHEQPPGYNQPPGSAQSARVQGNPAQGHGQGQRSYTDQPREKQNGRSGRGYTEPRRLDFQDGQITGSSTGSSRGQESYNNGGGAYVDDSDTVV